jgi:Predicted ATPase
MDSFSLGETGLRSHRSSARIACVLRLISGHGRYLGRGWCVVRARGSIQSPVLVGRDSFLALIEDRLAAAAAGEGRLLFVAGEAGIGKTRLLSAVARRAGAGGFAVVGRRRSPMTCSRWPACCWTWPATCCPPAEPALSELGQSLTSRVRAISAAAGDAHHRRRVLVQDLADLLVTADPGTPVLIILEDLHWADELSLDVLGHLASRLATRPLLVTGAYRSDELYPRLPCATCGPGCWASG